MHRAARLSAILDRLADGGSVAVADLAGDLDASPATIRRDLVILEQQRLLARTHGGATAHAVSYELSGPIAEASLTGLNLNVAFIGVDGIDAQAGCTTHHEVEAHTNGVMLRCARRVVVVADSSKIGKVAFARICEVGAVSELITDAAADPDAVSALTDCGVQVTLVGERQSEARVRGE
jgi:DeoR/GlpR family transcriptional regulator of sugar metabolism